MLTDMSDTRHLLTTGEAGHILRMLPTRISRLARQGDIPSVMLPDGEVRFLEADLWAWVERHRRPEGAAR